MIRKLTRSDAPRYKELRLQALTTNPESYFATFEEENRRDLSAFGSEISIYQEPYGYYGWFDDDEILRAYIQVSPTYFRKTAHVADIYNLYVDPKVRRQGVAHQLFDLVLGNIKALSAIEILFLTVMDSNTPARKLYESLGFVTYGTKEKSIKGPTGYLSEVLMRYDIHPLSS